MLAFDMGLMLQHNTGAQLSPNLENVTAKTAQDSWTQSRFSPRPRQEDSIIADICKDIYS